MKSMKFTALILLGGLFFTSCENRALIDENSDFSQVDGKKTWYSSYHLAYEQRFAYLNVKK